jgi:hypothetical protein
MVGPDLETALLSIARAGYHPADRSYVTRTKHERQWAFRAAMCAPDARAARIEIYLCGEERRFQRRSEKVFQTEARTQ